MRRFSGLFCALFILIVLAVRYDRTTNTFQNGTMLLLPVTVTETGQDAFSPFVKLRYHNFIPVYELTARKSSVIIERLDDGRVEFVSATLDRPLRPRELPIKYVITRSFDETETAIRFAADFLRFRPVENFRAAAVRYAVVSVNRNGDTVLTGLTDGNGVPLVKALSVHTPETI